MFIPEIETGINLTIQKKIEMEDTALHYGSGQLDNLLATPSLVALMIEASSKLVDSKLTETTISVGKSIKVVHDKPTIQGCTVSVKAEVKSFDGKMVTLELTAYDEIGQIGTGIHERVIVNKKSLLESAAKRAAELEDKNF